MVAGKCHCKKFTDGPRCDQCTNGYWNFTAENPDGCQGIYDRNVYKTRLKFRLEYVLDMKYIINIYSRMHMRL